MPSIIKVDQIQSDTGTVNQTSNLSFTGTGQRITGDFSGSTPANRVFFETSTPNTSTTLGIKPNGTGTNANFGSYSNDFTNGSVLFMGVTNGATEARLNSTVLGTGPYLPITFYTGGVERLRIPTDAAGIKFPATQAASSDPNTLDDYEEGTAVVRFGNSDGSVFTSVTVPYTKIGRSVTLQINIEAAARPAGISTSSQLFLTNLPFSMGNSEGEISARNFPIGLFVNLGGTDLGGFTKTWRWNTSTSLVLQYHTGSSTNDVVNPTWSQMSTGNNLYIRTEITYNTI
jgi:hypothetical protein